VRAEPPVVSNAGPLIVLAKLNLLHLLRELYGYVSIPRSVYDEVVHEGIRQGHEDARRLLLFFQQAQWNPDEGNETATPSSLREALLDQGERDTITLALTLEDPLILMDEIVGRRIAREQGLRVRGTLGVLIEAYQRGVIGEDDLRAHFAEIATRRDIWINGDLVERLLQQLFSR
jgi:hypothetical protein